MAQETNSPDDALAAEYVLGVLEEDARADVARRIRQDVAFARLVEAWEEHLSGLNDSFEDIVPPDRVKAGLDAKLSPARPRMSRWWAALGGLVAAAVVLFVVFVALPPQTETLVAALSSEDTQYAFDATIDGDEVTLVATGADAPSDRDLELWLIAGDNAPVSLGLLGGDLSLADHDVTEGVTLAVSLEPKGGSPTGAPTGMVVAVGELKKNSET